MWTINKVNVTKILFINGLKLNKVNVTKISFINGLKLTEDFGWLVFSF